MKILIELETELDNDLRGLKALIAAVGGEAPPVNVDISAPPAPPLASEALIERMAAGAAPSAPAASPPGDPDERDVNGLPWDERIHSGTRVKNADGSWRARRGVDDATVTAVTAELKARDAQSAPEAPAAPTPAPETAAPTPDTAFTPPASTTAPEIPAAAEAPSAPVAPPAPPPADNAAAPPAPDGGWTYPRIIKLVGEKGLDYDELNKIAALFGLAAFKDLAGRADLFDAFVAALP